jgi:PAS domain S-box-containing protein
MPVEVLLPELVVERKAPGGGRSDPPTRDVMARRADGSSFPAEVALSSLEGGALLATIVDISARKQTEDALREREAESRRLALVAARTTNGVVITDDHGRTQWINEGFVRLTGYGLDELRGRRPGDVLQVPGTDPATVDYIREQVTNRVPFAAEVLNRRNDGGLFWVRVDATPLFGDDGTFSGYITIQTDVTERREADEALRASQERYRAFIALSTEGVYRFESNQDIPVTLPVGEQAERMLEAVLAECNDAFARMYGFERAEEMLGRPLHSFLPRSDPKTLAFLRGFVEENYRLTEVETLEQDKEGGVHVFSNALFGVVNEGRLVRAWGTQRDVTAQRRAEAARRESEATLQLALEVAHMGTWELDLETGLIRRTASTDRLFGLTSDLKERTFEDYRVRIHPEDAPQVDAGLRRTQQEGTEFYAVYRVVQPGGEIRWHTSRGRVERDAEGNPARIIGAIVDSTDVMLAEAALRESEERARLALDAARQGLWTWDPQAGVLTHDQRTLDILGLQRDEPVDLRSVLARSALAEDVDHITAAFDLATDPAGDGRLALESRVLRPDSTVRWVRATGRMFFAREDGDRPTPVRMVGTLQDVTERREAEEALRESEQRFRLALEGGGMGTFEWNLATDAVLIDGREAELLGRPPEEVVSGEEFFRNVHPEDVAPLREAVSFAMQGLGDYTAEFRYIKPDGEVRWLAGRGHVILDDGKPVRMMGLNFDITERRRAEEELRRRTREMEQFTYTVSHDLKSPLVTITGFLGMLETHVQAGRPERARVAADRIRKAAGRMNELIDDLLELSRVGRIRGEVTVVDVGALVEEVADGLRRRMAAARCRLRVSNDMPRVRADARRLREAFENLLTNALKYACVAGATTVEVWSEIVDDEVRYVVEDDGPGIEQAYHRTIFDLFQRLGGQEVEGTGMGLAIVSKIMEIHEGRAWVESSVGEGSRFYLGFPRKALVVDAPAAAPVNAEES